ncbi:serine/threonine-protein kinase [Nocardioides sp. Kera G14]|uniref:serine/threonine-protein kinase n=1 Tax=Nocardioides sp. Kera G14 TaxID=2884264 RepID=UPI001D12DEDD|nr:serine/threonine-protein kinase [Nocardioides sp. Kera G14]UDY22714.1 serine/threonine protein kinase [Nocardioides sp. Kera G14]
MRGEKLGRYRLERVIGEGGMGVVHLARLRDGTPVAVKVLRPQVIGDREARDRLAREVSSLQRVHSRWVAEILDADPWGQTPYVVTRYVPGRSLHQVVAEDGPITGEDLTWLARGLLEGIRAVHSAGVLHRDVKPSNVLMEGRTPVLIDFGLARVADDPRLTQTGWLLGTPGYLAPEVLFGDDPTPAVDVHAWAATVAYAATGRPPYGRGPAMAIMDRTRRGEHDLTGVTGPLLSVLESALSPEPAERPTVDQLLDWLRGQVDEPTARHEALHDTAERPAVTRVLETDRRDRAPSRISQGQNPQVAGRTGAGERGRRLVLWLILALAWAAGLSAYPWIGSAVLLLVVWLLRSGSIAGARVGAKRAERGARWHDGPRLVLGAPIDLVRALPTTIVLALWAFGMVVATVLLCYAVAAPVAVALLSSGVVVVLSLLLGPGGGQVRSPVARVLKPLAAGMQGWLVTLLVLVAVAGVCGGLAARGADWTPFEHAPFSGLDP